MRFFFQKGKRISIVSEYQGFTDEITPQQISDARRHWTGEEVADFIEGKASDLSWAAKITIRNLSD